MATIDVNNLDGKTVGAIDLADSVFGAEVNEHLFYEVVKAQLATRRAGTHSTKRRADVRGGGKKLYKQKGTGNARQGSIRAPHYVGGGKVSRPSRATTRTTRRRRCMAGALRSRSRFAPRSRSSSSSTASTLAAIKTKRVATALDDARRRRRRWSSTPRTRRSRKSTRNLPNAKFLPPEGLNVYDLLGHEHARSCRERRSTPSTARLKSAPRTEEGAA